MLSALEVSRFNSWCLSGLIILSISCTTDSAPPKGHLNLEGEWSEGGLSELAVNNFTKYEGTLFAATDSGLYKTSLGANNFSWVSSGLRKEEVLKVVVLRGEKLLAAVRISDFSSEDTSLYLSSNFGQNWQPWMNNYGGEEEKKYTWVEFLTTASIPSDTIYARGNGLMVARSVDGGLNWSLVNGDSWDSYGGVSVLVSVDPYHKGRVWAGGVNGFSQPYLLKSTDYGETWKNLETLGTALQICYDVVSHPEQEHVFMAGLSGNSTHAFQILKTSDNGKSWETVFEDAGIRTMVHDARNPEIAYASGISINSRIFFIASGDFGESWQSREYSNGPIDILVNNIVSVVRDNQHKLYFATNQGVYIFRFAK